MAQKNNATTPLSMTAPALRNDGASSNDHGKQDSANDHCAAPKINGVT